MTKRCLTKSDFRIISHWENTLLQYFTVERRFHYRFIFCWFLWRAETRINIDEYAQQYESFESYIDETIKFNYKNEAEHYIEKRITNNNDNRAITKINLS